MAHVKITGLDAHLNPIKSTLSDIIHDCIVEALAYPADKRFHRFFPMHREDLIVPTDRSDAYTLIEITMMEGRSKQTKKQLIATLFQRIEETMHIEPVDLEVILYDQPAYHFGFRGMTGDEAVLDYPVEV